MKYQVTIQGRTHTVSEATAKRMSSGRAIPLEGLTVEGSSQNLSDPNHKSEKFTVFIKPIA